MPVYRRSVLQGSHEDDQPTNVEMPDYDFPFHFKNLSIREKNPDVVYSKRSPVNVDLSLLSKAITELHQRIERNPQLSLSYLELCKAFYKIQPIHRLGKETDVVRVPIFFMRNLHARWIPHFREAVSEVNEAAPGLCLFETSDEYNASIIVGTSGNENCYTCANILTTGQCRINVSDHWKGSYKGTSTHELLHALGFEHEMKRLYASLHVVINTGKISSDWIHQYQESDAFLGLTRFDPLSIMMYTIDERMQPKQPGDPVWKMNPSGKRPEVMSELDKVALNLVYKPCKTYQYDPKISTSTGILYCGRNVTATHDKPSFQTTDGNCGPNNGPNCPACRVLVEPHSSKSQRLYNCGKWQGWSGRFYCGGRTQAPRCQYRFDSKTKIMYLYTHDGVCGPNNGPPCNNCWCEMS